MIIIKVIQNNFNQNNLNKIVEVKPKIVHTFCDHCDSELEVSEEDTHIGWLGAAFVKCPCCGQESMVDELEGITLTKDNIEFPVHFNRTKVGLRHIIEVHSEEIIKEIKRGIEFLRTSTDNDGYWYTSYDDLFVIVFKDDGDQEYYVLVTKDFYETYIPFEEEDYND